MSLNKKLLNKTAAATGGARFNIKLYTGDYAATNALTGLGFSPDLVWIKNRPQGDSHRIFDTSRGATKYLASDTTGVETTSAITLKSFDSDGFTVGSDGTVNATVAYVAWCWGANGGTTSTDNEGDITSTVQVNDDAGFSIVEYIGNQTAGATIGHGLSVAPEVIILKNLTRPGYGWLMYHKDISPTSGLVPNTTDAKGTTAGYFNDTATTSDVFSLGGDTHGNSNGYPYIAYCWTPISGFSKFGSYTGNGGTQSITGFGFQPDFIIIKSSSLAGTGWRMIDSVRGEDKSIRANTDAAEYDDIGNYITFISDGFSMTSQTNTDFNYSGATYIYMAFKINVS